MKNLFILFCLLGCVCSCSKILKNDTTTNLTNESKKSDFISIDEAIENYNLFMSDVNTKTILDEKKIANVVVIENPIAMPKTKSSETMPLLYVLNYENNEGYAVVSADKRIGTDVLAVTEKGNFSQDYNGTESITENIDNPVDLIKRYAIEVIIDTIPTNPDIIAIDPIEGGDKDDGDVPEGEWIITVWDRVETENAVPVMLKTKWHQGKPFNNQVGDYAGCTAIAMIQIMAYNEYPKKHVVGGIVMPYSELRLQTDIENDNSIYAKAVAALVKDIQNKCHATDFGDKGTLIWPKYAEQYFKDLGYKNVYRYADDKKSNNVLIANTLEKGYPVFISALSTIKNAHSWVIDGMVKKLYVGRKVGEKTGVFRGDVSRLERYFHCNWGNEGIHDGYFLEGVFNINKDPYNFDYLTKNTEEGNYNSFYRIITYEIPE